MNSVRKDCGGKKSLGLMDYLSFTWWQLGFCLYPIRPDCSYSDEDKHPFVSLGISLFEG